MGRTLGIADKLLSAAFDIEENGKKRFSAEDLVVAAWKRFPRAFGLQGYFNSQGNPIYPNSNRVYAEIMGKKPLRKQGLLRKVGDKMYELTEAGRARARQYQEIPSDNSVSKWALARETAEQIHKLFESKTVQKFHTGKFEEVSFFDACGFWGITPRTNAKELWSRFAEFENVIDTTIHALGPNNIATPKHGAIPYTAKDIQDLRVIHQRLQEKFANEIALIKTRTDERKV